MTIRQGLGQALGPWFYPKETMMINRSKPLRCTACGAPIAGYNKQLLCHPCVREKSVELSGRATFHEQTEAVTNPIWVTLARRVHAAMGTDKLTPEQFMRKVSAILGCHEFRARQVMAAGERAFFIFDGALWRARWIP